MLRPLITLVLVVLAFGSSLAPAMAGDEPCKNVRVCKDGKCVFEVVCPGGESSGGGEEGDPTKVTKCAYMGQELACQSSAGSWSTAHACWLRVKDVQDPPPKGKKDEDGNWYYCTPPPPHVIGDAPPTLWIDGPIIVWVDPGPLAETALATMPLTKPELHLAPKPPLMTYVGLETWLWTPDSQWGVLTAQASAGGATVTATATPLRVRWDMTEGIATCNSPGRAWVTGMSSNEETTCSYTYDNVSDGQPDDAYPVTAQMLYEVTWTCTGPCLGTEGSLGVVPGPVSDVTGLRVGERQSVVIR